MSHLTPKIVYMGTPEFAVAPLDAIVRHGFQVAGVVTVPDKPSGRGLKLNESAVKKYALEAGLPVLQPVSLKDPQFLEELAAFQADLFIVVAFRMLPKVVWSMPVMGTFNLHGSLLPQYRGAAPINWAIIRGEKKTGVTTFLIDEKIDTGNILLQEACPIGERDTVGILYDKLMLVGADLVVRTIGGLTKGTLVPKPQVHLLSPNTAVHDAPKITKELCRIHWDKTPAEIDRLIRGLSPYPAAVSVITNQEKSLDVKIFEAEPVSGNLPERTTLEASGIGRIFSDHKTYVHVLCQNGLLLSLKDLQIAGKKRMKIKDFLSGFRDISSYRFI